jgi:N-acyl-D-aspartate/D-glutamate deacylase
MARGLKLVQGAASRYPEHRDCFSCHHQTLPMLAMVSAREHGGTIDDELLQDQAEFTLESFRALQKPLKEGQAIGGKAMTVSYGLWALDLAGRKPDEVTEAMVTYLLKTQETDGHWPTHGRRPPLEESIITSTALSAFGIDRFASPGQRSAAGVTIGKAKAWLVGAKCQSQEDRILKLWALHRLKADADTVLVARQAVLDAQRDDGGWAQNESLSSDAYATGQALRLLVETKLDCSDPAYRRGLAFLLKNQLADGSWRVETRAQPVQVYFDNGDPHGKHQFISTSATSWAVAALACALSAAPVQALGQAPAAEPYDLVIRGGKVVDGTGNPWSVGDVAIRSDRIVAVGRIAAHPARREIDARGLVVAPGFIDMHSHSDMQLLEDGAGQSKIRQGVTTEVLGEDTSGGPAKGKLASKSARVKGETVEWTTLAGYLGALEKSGIAPNVASYVGLGTIWQCVMGDSFERPSSQQFEQMKALIAEAMDEGAFGLSSMLASPPGLLSKTDDLVALCQPVHDRGGLFSSHIRNEGTGVIEAINEAIAVGERAEVPVDIIHIKIADQALWGRMQEIVDLINAARARGVNVQSNIYPYTRGNNNLSSIIPPWAHEGGNEALLARLKDPEARTRMKRDIKAGLPGWYNHYTAVGGDWSRMLISARLSPPNRSFEGQTMDRVLAARSQDRNPGPDPLDLLLDFLVEERGSVGTIYAHHTEADMNLALRQPWCSIGSDGSALAIEGPLRQGSPHPRSFGTFPRILGVYVRQRGLLSLEDAVRKITALNAAKLGLTDRGLLRPGQFADVTVFDPDRVIDKSTYLEPFQYNEGISYVVVNGQVVLDQGHHTGARPGRALRHGK